MGGGEIKVDHQQKFLPALRWGVKYISIAFFLKNPDDPVVWRGPMFGKAINQLFSDVSWGDVEICIVDMPPGTGDAQLSLAQLVKLDGAIVVTTPQEVALADVRRAINMFDKVNVPVLGIVENMNGFVTPSGEKYEIFGSGGGKSLAAKFNLDLLSSLPIDISIRESGDSGNPIASNPLCESGKIFNKLAEEVLNKISENQENSLKLNIVN